MLVFLAVMENIISALISSRFTSLLISGTSPEHVSRVDC